MSRAPQAVEPNVRHQLGRFELLMEMGQGGMATLYLARMRGPDDFEKVVAIKKIHDHLVRQSEFVNMFLDEAKIAAQIHHPNVATIFDFGRIDGAYFIAMEYVQGRNLSDLLRESHRRKMQLPWEHAVQITAAAAAGLHAAHELRSIDGTPLNVVHRDVSPQNILISTDGHVKVVDFGIAYAAERIHHTTDGTIKGRAAYMSPEQVDGLAVDRRSDIFSLGVLLYESLCLRRLFRAETQAASLLRVREAVVPPLRPIRPDLPVDVELLVLKALAKDPNDRFSSAQEMAEAFHESLRQHQRVVTTYSLAKLVHELLGDQIAAREAQIKQVLQNPPAEIIVDRSVGHGTGGSSTLTAAGEASLLPFRARRRWVLPTAAGVIALSLAIGLGVFFLGGAPKKDSAPATPKGVPGAPSMSSVSTMARDPLPPPRSVMVIDAKQPSTVRLKVVVTPEAAGASFTFMGQKTKGSPFEVIMKRSSKAETLEIRADGYLSRSLVIVPSQDTSITIALMKRKTPMGVMRWTMRGPPMGVLEDLPK